MRILYHHRSLADGAEGIHIDGMVDAFRSLGHEVHVRGLAAASDDPTRRTWVERVRNSVPRVLFELATTASNVAEYLDTQHAVREIRPHFVYKRHARNDVGAIYAARRLGVPLVLEVNCVFTSQEYRQFEPMVLERMGAAMEARALRLSTVTLAVSTPLAKQIDRLASTRALVLPNGVDPVQFDPARAHAGRVRARYGLGDSPVVGWTGVIREWHGLELLIESLQQVPRARLLVIGDGPARPAIERHAAALGLSSRVVITGRTPHDEMPDHLATLDVAVVAHDRTGIASPMKLLEYMAMGCAVVAPRLDNICDIVDDGENGLLFRPGDAAELGHTLAVLLANPALRARLGRQARATVENTRNWRRNAAVVLDAVAPSLPVP